MNTTFIRTHIQVNSIKSTLALLINMKLFIVLALVAVAAAAPQGSRSPYEDVQLVKYYFDNIGVGPYYYGYEQSNGQKHEEKGELRNAGSENEFVAVKGSYSYIGDDNVKYTVNYIADENGFQPEIEQGPGGGVPPSVVASLLG